VAWSEKLAKEVAGHVIGEKVLVIVEVAGHVIGERRY
jgi:hypothetical protein